MMSATLYGMTAVALLLSWWFDREKTHRALKIGAKSLHVLLPKILGMIALVGLVLALVPPGLITKLFSFRGIGGFVLVAAIGAIITMPAPIAFPLVGSLLRLGAAPATLATFVTTLTMVGIITAPIEISYFGRRFTLIRQSLSFVTAVIIGLLMGVFL
ncbi:permease [Trichlorobacter lovleyi]|uniref:permease n=1 Tax=Trichlorobacter lovleyi TaxID=313985 RepID=UPI00223F0FFA|nr:permease [Trichlorobacter lovleyi]QOX77523.1 permease [Trichlorobacter lovleyi]